MPDTTIPQQEKNPFKYYKKWEHHNEVMGTLVRICDEFIVHVRKDGKLDWETDDELVVDKRTLMPRERKELAAVHCKIIECEKYSLSEYSPEQQVQYLTLLGEAYAQWIENDAACAQKLLEVAQDFYKERSEEISRKWYLTTTMWTAGVLILVGVIAWLARGFVVSYIGTNTFRLGLAACAGGMGALFSVIARSGKLKFKTSSGRILHRLEAISRVSAGAISGIIAYLAFSSELILAPLLKNPHRIEMLLLVSIAAGSGERLATSIISKFDGAKVRPTANESGE